MNDRLDSLRSRRDVLRAELAELGSAPFPRNDERIRELSRGLAAIGQEIRDLDPGARQLMSRMTIAKPCNASWDTMAGSDRVRHCGICRKNVYDIRALTSIEVETLFASMGETPCVRIHQRRDGSVMTAECERGSRTRSQAKVAAVIAAGVAVACALPAVGYGTEHAIEVMSQPSGRAAIAKAKELARSVYEPVWNRFFPPPPSRAVLGEPMMGAIAAP